MESGGPRAALGGRFFLEEKLGEDASGELHRGLDLRSGTAVVVRIVRGDGNARRGERLLRDTRRAAGVKHPGLANVLGVGETPEGDIFVAAETLMGDRLSDRLAMGEHFEVHEAAEIATQISAALAAAHGADVVHRLLRPSLVVLSYEGDATIVKVEGLGVPRPPTDSEEDPEVAFSAPEQRRGETVGRRADVYSVGAMLFAMLTGEAPSADAPAVEGPLAEVVAKCLAEDAKDRYVDTSALRAAMKEVTDALGPRVNSKMPMAVSVPPPVDVPPPPPIALAAAPELSVPPAPPVSSAPPPNSDAAIVEARKVFDTSPRVSIIPLSDDGVPPVVPPADSSAAMAFVSSSPAPKVRVPAAEEEPAWKTWIMHGPPTPRAAAAGALAFVLTVWMVPAWAALVLALVVGGGAFAVLRARP